MIILGLLLGLIGTDVNSGLPRFSFDVPELSDGINFVVVAMGVFGLGEIIFNLQTEKTRSVTLTTITGLMPSREDLKRIVAPILRGTALGSALGILPGGGAMLSSFAAYSLEKKASKNSAQFGKGAIEGVAAPEAANNAGAQASFIPMLTLGIPSNPVMALMIGALIMHGIQPGPQVMVEQPALFWGLVVSMWIGNLFLLILNLPLIGLWVKMISVPYHFLYPAILVFCGIGVFSLSNTSFDVYLMARFRSPRLRLPQARLRAGADDAGVHPRADDGGVPAPRDADLPRQRDGARHPADQRHAAGGIRGGAGSRTAAGPAQEARGSVQGLTLPELPRRTR